MTKKDYELIAESIARVIYTNYDDPERAKGAEEVGRLLAEKLAGNNPKFDLQKFLTVCGIECKHESTEIVDDNYNNEEGSTDPSIYCNDCGKKIR